MANNKREVKCLGLALITLLGACAPDTDDGSSTDEDLQTLAAGSVKYVAMGSSYAAGPSIPDAVPGQDCGRSTHNYAHLVAAELGLRLTDVSCSGAVTDNITTSKQGSHALQIEAVTPDTKIVTITIGGNDFGYAGSLVTCGADGAKGKACLGHDIDGPHIDSLLAAEEQKLVTMLDAVKHAAPNAQIYLVSYPRVLPDSPVSCPDAPIEPGDATFLAGVGAKFQDASRRAAQAAGVHFVDVYGASNGHTLCTADSDRWIEGQKPGVAAYHPNAKGHRAEADLIEAAIFGAGANTFRFVNPHSGKCLDITGASKKDGTNVELWTCNGTGAQSFHVQASAAGGYELVNTNSGKCLDIKGAGTANGTNVELWPCNGSGAQSFDLQHGSDGATTFVNTHSHSCVDVNQAATADRTKVQLWGCDSTAAQKWQLQSF